MRLTLLPTPVPSRGSVQRVPGEGGHEMAGATVALQCVLGPRASQSPLGSRRGLWY